MTATRPELIELAELNPVPLASVRGQCRTEKAEALMQQIMRSATIEARVGSQRTWIRIVLAGVLVSLSIAGVAIGARILTDKDVETSLPAGSTVFVGAQPDCSVVESGSEYRCHLTRTPRGMTVVDADGRPAFLGAKLATVDATQHINGGCVALNDLGTEWSCYVGDTAVRKGVIDGDTLGQLQTEPAAG